MTAPEPGVPAWLPDPTDRHEFRWFDGTAFTDRVADGGVPSIDPGPRVDLPPTPPTAPPTASWPAFTTAPGAPTTTYPAPVAAPPAPTKRKVPVPALLAAAGVLLLVGGGAVVLLDRTGGGGGSGTFDATIDDDHQVVVHDISLSAGEAVLVTVRPGDDLDAVIGLLVDDDVADELDDAYEDAVDLGRRDLGDTFDVDGDALDADALGTDADQVVLRTDLGFPGEDEQLLLVAPVDMELHLVVGPFDPDTDEGDYEAEIEIFDSGGDEGDDGGQLLEAVADDDDAPNAARDLADDLLGND